MDLLRNRIRYKYIVRAFCSQDRALDFIPKPKRRLYQNLRGHRLRSNKAVVVFNLVCLYKRRKQHRSSGKELCHVLLVLQL